MGRVVRGGQTTVTFTLEPATCKEEAARALVEFADEDGKTTLELKCSVCDYYYGCYYGSMESRCPSEGGEVEFEEVVALVGENRVPIPHKWVQRFPFWLTSLVEQIAFEQNMCSCYEDEAERQAESARECAFDRRFDCE